MEGARRYGQTGRCTRSAAIVWRGVVKVVDGEDVLVLVYPVVAHDTRVRSMRHTDSATRQNDLI
jgi:hypothetical protein